MMPRQVSIAGIEWMMDIRDIISLHHIEQINVIGLCDRAFSSNERKGYTLQCPAYNLIIYQFFHERWYLERFSDSVNICY